MILNAQNRKCLDRNTLISSLLLPGSLKQNKLITLWEINNDSNSIQLEAKQAKYIKQFKCCSSLVVTCCVTCYFDSDPPRSRKAFFRLESCALNTRDRGLSFCYFFEFRLCILIHSFCVIWLLRFFFDRQIITTIVALKYHYKNYLPSVMAIFWWGRGTKIYFQVHLFEFGKFAKYWPNRTSSREWLVSRSLRLSNCDLAGCQWKM